MDVDPRFTLANERTYLAWIRTALGLLAGAAALHALELPWPQVAVTAISTVLVVLAILAVVVGSRRWQSTEAAIEAGEPVHPGRSHLVLAAGVGVIALAVLVLTLLSPLVPTGLG